MTHFGLGSSGEDPWGSLLGGLGVGLPSWEPAAVCLGGSAVPLGSLEGLCLAECLGFCLPDLVVT